MRSSPSTTPESGTVRMSTRGAAPHRGQGEDEISKVLDRQSGDILDEAGDPILAASDYGGPRSHPAAPAARVVPAHTRGGINRRHRDVRSGHSYNRCLLESRPALGRALIERRGCGRVGRREGFHINMTNREPMRARFRQLLRVINSPSGRKTAWIAAALLLAALVLECAANAGRLLW